MSDTRERVARWLAANVDHDGEEHCSRMADDLLALIGEGEPVAWTPYLLDDDLDTVADGLLINDGKIQAYWNRADAERRCGYPLAPLYLAPQPVRDREAMERLFDGICDGDYGTLVARVVQSLHQGYGMAYEDAEFWAVVINGTYREAVLGARNPDAILGREESEGDE